MTLAGALAYYAGQIIESPSVAWLVGLRPLAHAVSMAFMGWTCMVCAVVTAVAAVFRKRRWWVDRLGFAVATFPMAMWILAFGWSWADRDFAGYPPGGTFVFFAALTTIANLRLDRGAQISTEERP